MSASEFRPHPDCWRGDRYEHVCHQSSGRTCVDCGAPAGTPWGPYWCPDCDVVRLDRIDAALRQIMIESDIQRRQWETEGDMPDPDEVEGSA